MPGEISESNGNLVYVEGGEKKYRGISYPHQ